MPKQLNDKPDKQLRTPADWLLESVRRVPVMRFAVAAVGLAGAAALCLGFFFGDFISAIYASVFVLGAMVLLRAFAVVIFRPGTVDVSFAMKVVIWSAISSLVIVSCFGLAKLFIIVFIPSPPTPASVPILTPSDFESRLHALHDRHGSHIVDAFYKDGTPEEVLEIILRHASKGVTPDLYRDNADALLPAYNSGDFDQYRTFDSVLGPGGNSLSQWLKDIDNQALTLSLNGSDLAHFRAARTVRWWFLYLGVASGYEKVIGLKGTIRAIQSAAFVLGLDKDLNQADAEKAAKWKRDQIDLYLKSPLGQALKQQTEFRHRQFGEVLRAVICRHYEKWHGAQHTYDPDALKADIHQTIHKEILEIFDAK